MCKVQQTLYIVVNHVHMLAGSNSHKSNDNLFNSFSGLVKMCNSRCKENHFYSLPFGQAEANIY